MKRYEALQKCNAEMFAILIVGLTFPEYINGCPERIPILYKHIKSWLTEEIGE